MAAAEARAAWQHAANRCFMQEDVKRAPKLAGCPSSSSTEHYDPISSSASNEQDYLISTFVSLNWTSMNSSLPPDTRSWLHLNPSFVHPKDITPEQPNALANEVEEKLDYSVPISTPLNEMKTLIDTLQQPLEPKVYMEDYFSDDGFVCRKMEKRNSEVDLPWEVGNKCEPWWRISDQDELASLVAQRSLEHIENCDLPTPIQRVVVSRVFPSPVSCKSHTSASDLFSYPSRSWKSGSFGDKYWSMSESTEKLHSSSPSYSPPTSKNRSSSIQNCDTNSSRDPLLEALRHSQTRAREAEIAARKAHDENNHIVQLFFRQASHLFAYKQWLHTLQLERESLCLQLRIKEHQISTLFPVLCWNPMKGSKARSRGKKQRKCSFCKYAFVFAVGLGLVGAGLLLGWTLGWLLPHL